MMDSNFNGRPFLKTERRGHKSMSRRSKDSKRGGAVFTVDENIHTLRSPWGAPMPQHRMMASGEATAAYHPMHVTYPIESYQLPMYAPMYQVPQSAPPCPVPPVRKYRRNGTPIKNNVIDEIVSHEYASLPPVNGQLFSPKSSDSESNSKRHFSDPGVGAASSDDSDFSCRSLSSPILTNLLEEVAELKKQYSLVSSQILNARQELTEIKLQGCSKCAVVNPPGAIIDLVAELRSALEKREEAALSKIEGKIHANFTDALQQISALATRLTSLEQIISEFGKSTKTNGIISEIQNSSVATDASLADQNSPVDRVTVATTSIQKKERKDYFSKDVNDSMCASSTPVLICELQRRNQQLEKQLDEAKCSHSEAEANTQKLERLVSILRNKIKNLSNDACLPGEKPLLTSTGQLKIQKRSTTAASSVEPPSLKVRDFPAIFPNPDNNGGSLKSKSTLTTSQSGEEEKTPAGKSSLPQLCRSPQPPAIPPRPAVLSPPHGSNTARPLLRAVADADCKGAGDVKTSEIAVESCVDSESGSSLGSSSSGVADSSGTSAAVITITGPVTDL